MEIMILIVGLPFYFCFFSLLLGSFLYAALVLSGHLLVITIMYYIGQPEDIDALQYGPDCPTFSTRY